MKGGWLIVLFGLSTACAASPSPSPSIGAPSATPPVQVGAPSGCEPIDLRDPDGGLVDLSGSWAGSGVLAIDHGEVAVFQQIGRCIYGSMRGLDGRGNEAVIILSGRMSRDFTVAFDVVAIEAPAAPIGEIGWGFPEWRTVVMAIEWDGEGRLRLREDREARETGVVCTTPFGATCPDPVIWYAVEEGPAP